jgi:hypothetical protein
VLGALVLSAGQFALTDASHAVASLAIFLAAGSRIAPATLANTAKLAHYADEFRSSFGHDFWNA